MNPQHRGFNRSNNTPSAAPLPPNTPYAINTSPPPPMPSYNSFSQDLKWHNTLPEDFTDHQKSTAPEHSPAVNIRKHPPGPLGNIDAILQSHVHHTTTSPTLFSPLPPTHRLGSSPAPSPSKRTRALQNTSVVTPTKNKSSNNLKSSGSGMQTPPPSSTATARKRGRPSKKSYPAPAKNNSYTEPQTSPTKHQKLNGNQSCQNLNLQHLQSKFNLQQLPDSGIAMPSSDEAPTNFNQKYSDNLWGDGNLDFITGLTGNSHGLEHSASFDWSSLRNNASLDNLPPLADIFAPTAPRRRQSQSSLTDEGTSDNPTFSFLEFDDPYGLEMPLDVNPNLLFSSTTSSAASSMIGGSKEECKPFAFVQQPYQHQHLQHLREQELETQRQKQLQERISKERLKRERTIAASGGRNSRHSSVLKHSMSDGVLTGPGGRQDCRAANFNSAVLKRSCSNIGRRGEMVLVGRSSTPEPPRKIYGPPPSTLRRSMGKIPAKVPRTRTEVVLAISPGGRAKTETTVVYESSDTDVDEPVLWDSPQESDSSFDDDVPRGLGPDGIDYTLYRQRKTADPFQDSRAGPQRLNAPLYKNADKAPPRTPTRRSPLKMPLSGSQRKLNGFAASTAAAATYTSGRLDSSPRLPTPLKSSPPAVNHHLRERVRRASHSSLTPSQSMSVMGTPMLGSMQEVSDESEAETVVDGTDIGLLGEEEEEEEEEDGDAMYALKKVMMARRNSEANRVAFIECTPTKSCPSSATKPQAFLTGSGIGTRSSGRHKKIHPATLRQSPVKKKLFEEQILRNVGRQRKGHGVQTMDDSVITHRSRAMEKEGLENLGSTTRCICGEIEDDGGKMMVQCGSCHNWLHLKCVGYNRKSLPRVFECMFCQVQTVQTVQQGNLHKYQGRSKSGCMAGRRGSDDENSITLSLVRNGR